jgi:hypothetical protein
MPGAVVGVEIVFKNFRLFIALPCDLRVWLGNPSSPLWGGVGGGGVSTTLAQPCAHTPTPALPTRGREKVPASRTEPSLIDVSSLEIRTSDHFRKPLDFR